MNTDETPVGEAYWNENKQRRRLILLRVGYGLKWMAYTWVRLPKELQDVLQRTSIGGGWAVQREQPKHDMRVVKGKTNTESGYWIPGQTRTLSGGKRAIAVWYDAKAHMVKIEATNGEYAQPGEEPRATSIFLSEEALRAIVSCCRELGISLREKE